MARFDFRDAPPERGENNLELYDSAADLEPHFRRRGLGLNYSRGGYRDLGYGEPVDSPRRRVRYDLPTDTHEELLFMGRRTGEWQPERYLRSPLNNAAEAWEQRLGGRPMRQSQHARSFPVADRATPGSHAGKGSRHYKRSDALIAEDLNEKLTWHPDIDATDIEVLVKEGHITLSGYVASRYAKWTAEDLAEGTLGVVGIDNRLRLRPR